MGGLRTDVERLTRLLPDPEGIAAGYVVTTYSYVDERGITQYSYKLVPGGGGGTGTVTSVDASGGSTGLTFTGGPITTAGTLTLGGTLAIASGGTGQTTAPLAINALLPTQSGHSGEFLTTNGTVASWGAAGSTYTPPVTTKGDLFGYSTVPARVPVGADGTQLLADSTQATGLRYGSAMRGPGCIFSNGGLLLTGTLADEVEVPYGGTITGWTIVGDASGSASIVVSHSTYAAYDTMTTLFTATISSAIKNQATGLGNAITPGDILRFSGSGFSGFTRCSIVLTVVP